MIQFRPALWMSILLIPALLMLSGLGYWQLQRLAWKNDLIAKQDAGQDTLAKPVAQLINAQGNLPENAAWQRVNLRGKYVPDAPVFRLHGFYNGVVGLRHLTLFVDRGFARTGQAVGSAPSGKMNLTGFLHPAMRKGRMTPPPEITRNIWYWRDTVSMSAGLVEPDFFIANFVVDLEISDHAGKWPRAVGAPPEPVNNHLDYAFTWFGLALSLLIIYLVWHVKNGRLYRGQKS